MLFKSTLALAFMALANIVSASQTPACVISVMGDTANPDDLATICCSKTIQSKIQSTCGDNADSALTFFSNTCKSHGYTVEKSPSATTTGTGATGTATGFTTAASTSGSKTTGTKTSGSGSGSASSTASGSASAYPSPSVAGAVGGQQLSSTAFAAALFFGAAALL
ncbi:hypothetical protein N7466_004308 [Penicillium verhagenii]|uniref:uncharacterized protein n=1 Tax=Penicillium verhagenii TaxID=1562060 RepID=UPI0025457F34|nr:uncharacterized protein N7466_004308 [Penicillium verhagenii]KAJ5934761.1 hypothetical protein N7466_004308 [Penicillium verhagenii]